MKRKLDFKRILSILGGNWVFLLAVTALCGALSFLYASYFITPKYSSTAMFYVEATNADKTTLSSTDITAAQQLAETCKAILMGNVFISEVNEDIADENLSDSAVADMISIWSVNSTECFKVSVTSTDPHLSSKIAHAIVENASEIYARVVKYGALRIIDTESYSEDPVSPDIPSIMAKGLIIGFFVAFTIVFALELVDNKIKDEDDLFLIYEIPVFVEVTDFESLSKNTKSYRSYYSHYADEE